MKDSV